jgi:hypothetical protein
MEKRLKFGDVDDGMLLLEVTVEVDEDDGVVLVGVENVEVFIFDLKFMFSERKFKFFGNFFLMIYKNT